MGSFGDKNKRRYDPAIHHRRSIRLKGYDYSRPGAYFVTICLHDKDSWLLGEVIKGKIQVSRYGEIVWKCWNQLPRHYPNVKLDEFIVMPNHAHGVIWVVDPDEWAGGVGAGDNIEAGLSNRNIGDVKPARTMDGGRDDVVGDARAIVVESMAPVFAGGNRMPGGGANKYPLPEIIRGLKTFSARRINELRGIAGVPVWQRNYWEHMVRNEGELRRIREYIATNPARWRKDKLNPAGDGNH